MIKYFVVHKYLQDPAATWEFFAKGAPGLAAAMAEGKTPAKCLMTWNPMAHGRSDNVFCLWEANTPEDVLAVVHDSKMDEYLTSDVMPVAEIDWAQLALTAK